MTIQKWLRYDDDGQCMIEYVDQHSIDQNDHMKTEIGYITNYGVRFIDDDTSQEHYYDGRGLLLSNINDEIRKQIETEIIIVEECNL